jgi:hypothetical protein
MSWHLSLSKIKFYQMRFFSDEIRICENVAIEVTSKKVLDSSGNLDLLGSDNWQFGPVACQLIGDPE